MGLLASATPKELISSIQPHTGQEAQFFSFTWPPLKGTWVPKAGSKDLPHCGGEGRNTVSSQASQIPQVLARLVDQLNSVDVETEAKSQQVTFQRLEGNQGRPAS